MPWKYFLYWTYYLNRKTDKYISVIEKDNSLYFWKHIFIVFIWIVHLSLWIVFILPSIYFLYCHKIYTDEICVQYVFVNGRNQVDQIENKVILKHQNCVFCLVTNFSTQTPIIILFLIENYLKCLRLFTSTSRDRYRILMKRINSMLPIYALKIHLNDTS